MTLKEKLYRRLVFHGVELGPMETLRIRRTYAGYHQKSAGAWIATLEEEAETYRRTVIGWHIPLRELLKGDTEIYINRFGDATLLAAEG